MTEFKKTKKPVKGIYFPSEYCNFDGELLINFTVDWDKFFKENEQHLRENSNGKKYLKGCLKKLQKPDADGNLYFAFLNTYEHIEPKI